MKIWITAILLMIFAGTAAQAADSLPIGRIRVHSHNMQYYGNENKSTFTGNVVAVSDTYTLTADVVDVYFNSKNDVERIISKNNVNFKTGDILALSDYAEVDQRTKTIYLRGNSKIWQKENYLEGEKMQIQYETKEIYVDKGSGERVTVIFNSSDNQSIP